MGKRKEKIREFLRMSKGELQRVLMEKRDKLRQLRFDLAAGKVKNVREIREIKKDIARILTLLRKEILNSKS
jgi:large subunit ribosomal protein L29